jgi:hypothetical protein
MYSALTKKFKFIVLGLIIVLSFFMAAQIVWADGISETMSGLNQTATGGFGNEVITKNSDLPSVIGRIVGVALSFLGIIFFVLIIMGGYMWMTSMGNEQSTGKAKDILLAAIIGLFIVLIAYAATRLIAGIFV